MELSRKPNFLGSSVISDKYLLKEWGTCAECNKMPPTSRQSKPSHKNLQAPSLILIRLDTQRIAIRFLNVTRDELLFGVHFFQYDA